MIHPITYQRLIEECHQYGVIPPLNNTISILCFLEKLNIPVLFNNGELVVNRVAYHISDRYNVLNGFVDYAIGTLRIKEYGSNRLD